MNNLPVIPQTLCRIISDSILQYIIQQVDLLRGQKADKVDVTIQPEELDLMDEVLPAK